MRGLAGFGPGLRSVFRPRRAARCVLFGEKQDWHEGIRHALQGRAFETAFGDLETSDLTRYDLVVPLKLDDYPALRRKRDDARGRALFPEAETVALCDDKALFNRRIVEGGAGDLIPAVHAAVPARFPVILKRRHDEFGVHSHLVEGPQDVARHAALIADEAYFLQDYVAGGTEHTTHLLVREGAIRYFVNVAFDMGADRYVKGVRTTPRATDLNADGRFLDAFAAVLRAVGFRDGTCCLNYKLAAGRPQIFEMNPRFGGSLVNDLDAYLRAYAKAV